MSTPKTITVFANPFAAVDHEGRPCGAVLCDPVDHVSYRDKDGDPDKKDPKWDLRQYVGARIAESTVRIAPDKKTKTATISWEFTEQPVTLPQTQYYLGSIREGALIAADEATAKLARVQFKTREQAIADAKSARAAEWRTCNPSDKLPVDLAPPLALVKNTKKEVA